MRGISIVSLGEGSTENSRLGALGSLQWKSTQMRSTLVGRPFGRVRRTGTSWGMGVRKSIRSLIVIIVFIGEAIFYNVLEDG